LCFRKLHTYPYLLLYIAYITDNTQLPICPTIYSLYHRQYTNEATLIIHNPVTPKSRDSFIMPTDNYGDFICVVRQNMIKPSLGCGSTSSSTTRPAPSSSPCTSTTCISSASRPWLGCVMGVQQRAQHTPHRRLQVARL